jgi:hypothetical protein
MSTKENWPRSTKKANLALTRYFECNTGLKFPIRSTLQLIEK